MRLFSDAKRPVHLGPFPLERLARHSTPKAHRPPAANTAPPPDTAEAPDSITHAMRDYQAMMDALRHGPTAAMPSTIPDCPKERANHLKSFGYFQDAAMVGLCALTPDHRRTTPLTNPDTTRLADEIRTKQTKTLAGGIDLIMAELRETLDLPGPDLTRHPTALVFLFEMPRAPRPNEPGTAWLAGAEAQRTSLRATECATILATYLRLLGHDAIAHSATTTELDLTHLALDAGLLFPDGTAPFLGSRYALAAVTTALVATPDQPLKPRSDQDWLTTEGPAWHLGFGTRHSASSHDPYAKRAFRDGPHPFETLKRVANPTTYIDAPNVARVPKRTDLFARAQFGDMGPKVQSQAAGGRYVRKSPSSFAQRRLLSAFTLVQDGTANPSGPRPSDAQSNADLIKATAYWLGADAVGLSAAPDWVWYSHDATGAPITPPHGQAISIIIDQGYETMSGASGDDWISVAQSMRAYLRFSLIGGVLAKHIRALGYGAKAHTATDGDVLQPPLLLLSGLGEVSRIGEVILNPFLGPRLKSGVITTDMPITHDLPIDFGLQRFCEACNKCARECPSGAITAGPKKMFNGYEIWKSDSQRCATYRLTTEGGSMCGRCMKTCPWNLEGLFAEAPFRWAAMNLPSAAPLLAWADDAAGRGSLNPVKKWWWDIELNEDGAYRTPKAPVNARSLQRGLKIRAEDQTLAVYPAPLTPPPWPYPYPMDREAGIAAFRALLSPEEHRARTAAGDTSHLHRTPDHGNSPVIRVEVATAQKMTQSVTKYEFRTPDGTPLPDWAAGAHIDVVVTPEFIRQYSMSGNPADPSLYQIGVLREDTGRGGSRMMHRIFTPGRRVFISKPINHFPLAEDASFTFLMGGGIGVTPMIAFAHRLHALGRAFALHYSVGSRAEAGYLADLAAAPWADRVHLHISNENTRADLAALLGRYAPGQHVYTCGPDRYMQAVIDAATTGGFPDENRHLEYFSAPAQPERENHPFSLHLARSGRTLAVPADQSATDVLTAHGIAIDVKCADGICGVCKCTLLSGTADHRDFVLSNAQRSDTIILCQSRARDPDGILTIDL